ncbi:hypothetical protein HPB51_006416 [Rhipicephalus microplus]|uniref:Uncharacterized protein n=1 Tax=Rhipicephalus microplus TaxID=6941 RepID=A0A9J6EZ32_RHIMP|nr:hypothetical protein HPB51_006416 [Rhipicephalus microplus]
MRLPQQRRCQDFFTEEGEGGTRPVRREHKWVILLVRIVANIVCAMVLESAFVDPDLLDPVQCLAAVMVVFAGALTTLHLLVEGQENSPLVASHRFLQLFA